MCRFQFAAAIQRGVFRNRLVPNVMAEPVEVRLHQRQPRFRLIDAMAKSRIENQSRIDVLFEQSSVKLEGIRNRHSMIRAAVLNQGGGFAWRMGVVWCG